MKSSQAKSSTNVQNCTLWCSWFSYSIFTFTSEIHSRLLRSSSIYHLCTLRPKHELFRHSFTFSDASVWKIPLLTSKTHQMSNTSNVYIWDGSEILPIHLYYTDYRKDIMYTNNVNSTSWLYFCIKHCFAPLQLWTFTFN